MSATAITIANLKAVQAQLSSNINTCMDLYGLTTDPTQQLTLAQQANNLSSLMSSIEGSIFHQLAAKAKADFVAITSANQQIAATQKTVANVGTIIGYISQFASAVASLVKLLP